MPHAALWVVQQLWQTRYSRIFLCFNAARGFVGGATEDAAIFAGGVVLFQCRTRLCGWCNLMKRFALIGLLAFQCRTRLCGWCNWVVDSCGWGQFLCFNAARGFVGGATCDEHSASRWT